MADISKVKIPSVSTPYNIKDANAGYSIALELTDLLLKNAAGSEISRVTIPGLEISSFINHDEYTLRSSGNYSQYGQTYSGKEIVPKEIIIKDETNKKFLASILINNTSKKMISTRTNMGYWSSAIPSGSAKVITVSQSMPTKPNVLFFDSNASALVEQCTEESLPLMATSGNASDGVESKVTLIKNNRNHYLVINGSDNALPTSGNNNITFTATYNHPQHIRLYHGASYYVGGFVNHGSPYYYSGETNIPSFIFKVVFPKSEDKFSIINSIQGTFLNLNGGKIAFNVDMNNVSLNATGEMYSCIITISGLKDYSQATTYSDDPSPVSLTISTNKGTFVTPWMLPNGCMY